MSPASGSRAIAPDATISASRAEIDRLDATLRRALADRRRYSERVQGARRGRGGPPLDPTREQELIRCWTDELGPEAEPIVRAVLGFCRGTAETEPGPVGS